MKSPFLFSLTALLLCFTTILAVDNTEYYKIFGLDRGSFDKERLIKAYRKLAKQHHPDKNMGDKEAEAKFVEITKAFEVLNNDQKRRVYDQFGADAVDRQTNGGGGGHPFDFAHAEDIFNSYGLP
jgi:molecular chaperone DnaJ